MIKKLTFVYVLFAVITSTQAQTQTTVTNLNTSPSTTVYGENVRLMVRVVRTNGGAGTAPTGTVQFQCDGVNMGAPVALSASTTVESQATTTVSTLAVGNRTIRAIYTPSGIFITSSATVTHTVNKANTTVNNVETLLSFDRQSLRLSASLSVVAPGRGTPSGTIDFYLDGSATPLGSGTVGGGFVSFSVTRSFLFGTHTVTARYRGDNNFNASALSQPASFTVYNNPGFSNTATINKTYGDPPFALPAISGGFPAVYDDIYVTTYSYRSDNPAVASVNTLTGQVTITGIGEANINVKQLINSIRGGTVYETPESAPVKVVVSRKPVTVTGITATKEYDGTNVFTNEQIDITGAVINGRVGSDVMTLSKTGVTGTFGPNAGTGTLTLLGSFTLTGADAEKYILIQPTVTATITIITTPITVTALGGNSIYGESPVNPGLSATGLNDGDNVSVLTGLSNSFDITATTPVGVYTLSVIGNLTNPFYTITSRNTGIWTVNKRPITITANDKIIYEDETPTFDYTITSGSLVNGDVLTGELRCDPPYTLGTHPITQGTLDAGSNYDVTFIPGTLTVISDIVLVNDILVEGLPAERNGNNFSISSPCGASSVNVNVNTDQPATVRINGVQQNPHRINLPNYGENTFTVAVTSPRGNTETYTLTVYRSVPVEVAFYDRFKDVLTVPVHVEGIVGAVNSVEWYHNGVRLDRDLTKGYLEMIEPGAYHALLNGQFRTCEVIKSGTRSAPTMTVYPNPATARQEVTININSAESDLQNAQLQIHSLDGRLLKTLPVTGYNFNIAIPDYSGVIVIKLFFLNGNDEIKLIVK